MKDPKKDQENKFYTSVLLPCAQFLLGYNRVKNMSAESRNRGEKLPGNMRRTGEGKLRVLRNGEWVSGVSSIDTSTARDGTRRKKKDFNPRGNKFRFKDEVPPEENIPALVRRHNAAMLKNIT